MIHRQWPFQRSDRGAYGLDDTLDGGDTDAADVDDEDFRGDYGGRTGGLTGTGPRYLTVRPKQWCTSYVGANRQRYIHSTESDVNHNGGIGSGTGIGLDNDVYCGIGGRTTADFFRSKTLPRRTATGGTMMDDYDDGDNGDGNGTAAGPRTGHHRWPGSSADIAEYDDSSVAADTPTLQQQHTQFLLTQPQPQQPQRINHFPHRSGAGAADGKPAATASAAGAESYACRAPKSTSRWKTRALYTFLACLLLVVVVNLTLTLWFLRVTQFTSDGMGSMKVTHGGLRLSGRTLVTDRLVASAIRSRAGRPILIESTANITLSARNSQGRLVNSLKLTKDGLECAQANVFRVTDTRGETLFSADRSKVIVGAQELKVTGNGGAVFQGSVQTPMVRADSRHDLRLESASRRLELSGPQGVTIESRAGDITVSCLMDVKLTSIAGAIQIDAAKVFFKGLKTVKASANSASAPVGSAGDKLGGQHNSIGGGFDSENGAKRRGVEDRLPNVYQLCVCGNGKVFMSPPDGQCAADNESLVCR